MATTVKLTQFTTQELEAEIARRAEIDRKVPPELLHNDFYPVTESCRAYVESVKTLGRRGDVRAVFVAAMEAMYGSEIWTWIDERLS